MTIVDKLRLCEADEGRPPPQTRPRSAAGGLYFGPPLNRINTDSGTRVHTRMPFISPMRSAALNADMPKTSATPSARAAKLFSFAWPMMGNSSGPAIDTVVIRVLTIPIPTTDLREGQVMMAGVRHTLVSGELGVEQRHSIA